MTHNKLRPLTESSLLTAITVIIAIAGLYIPFVILFWTLPITIITAKHHLKYGLASVLISGVLLCMFMTPVTALPLIFSSAPLALTLGAGFNLKWSAVKIFVSSFIASLLGTALFLILTFYLTGINIFVEQLDAFKTAMLDTNEMFSSMGVTTEAMIDANRQTQNIIETLALVLPMLFIFNALLKLVINYMASSFLLKRLGTTDINTLPPFTLWQFSKSIRLYICLFPNRYVLGNDARNRFALSGFLNIYLCANVIGLIQGLSVIRFFYKLKQWPTAVWIFIIAMITRDLVFAQIVALAGFFDMIFNYRDKIKTDRN